MNSDNSNSLAYVFLVLAFVILGVFTYLNHQKSKDIDTKVGDVSVVIREYGTQIKKTNTGLEQTNRNLSTVKRKINLIKKKLNEISNNSGSDAWKALKNKVDDALGKIMNLHKNFDNKIIQIEDIDKRLSNMSSRLKKLEANQKSTSLVNPESTEESISIAPESSNQPTNKVIKPKEKPQQEEGLDSLLGSFDLN